MGVVPFACLSDVSDCWNARRDIVSIISKLASNASRSLLQKAFERVFTVRCSTADADYLYATGSSPANSNKNKKAITRLIRFSVSDKSAPFAHAPVLFGCYTCSVAGPSSIICKLTSRALSTAMHCSALRCGQNGGEKESENTNAGLSTALCRRLSIG